VHGRNHPGRDHTSRPRRAWPEREQAAPVVTSHASPDQPDPSFPATVAGAVACGPSRVLSRSAVLACVGKDWMATRGLAGTCVRVRACVKLWTGCIVSGALCCVWCVYSTHACVHVCHGGMWEILVSSLLKLMGWWAPVCGRVCGRVCGAVCCLDFGRHALSPAHAVVGLTCESAVSAACLLGRWYLRRYFIIVTPLQCGHAASMVRKM